MKKQLALLRPRKRTIFFSVLALSFFLLLATTMIWHTIALRKAIEQRTQNYLADVSQESAQMVDNRIEGIFQYLRLIADSISQTNVTQEQYNDFLNRKADICNFAEMALVDADGTAHFLRRGEKNIQELPAFTTALAGEASAAVFPNYILYFVPIPMVENSSKVLLGVKSITGMQNLLANNSFNNEGNTCILDQSGEIIIKPVQKNFNVLIRETDYAASADWAKEIQQNLQENRSGQTILATDSGRDILLSYRPLMVNGWFLATTVPKDILSSEVDSLSSRFFYLVIAVVSLFCILLLILIAVQNRYQDKIETISFTDPVTGGNSNICFLLSTQKVLQKNTQKTYILLSLNLRKFGLLNSFIGRSHGDDVLRQVYHILNDNTDTAQEMIARGEGTTFYLFWQNQPEEQILQRLHVIAQQIAPLGSPLGPLRIDVGIFHLNNGDNIAEAEEAADTARKNAEKSHLNTYTFYSEAIRSRQYAEATLLYQLEEALDNNKLTIHLQPKVRTRDGKIAGAEALVRWQHPKNGFINPAVFIPLCEENGLIRQLDLFVFEQVCKCLAEWQHKGLPLLPISVNVSRQHFKNPHFLDDYQAILQRWHIPPEKIELEITESIMFSSEELSHLTDFISEIHHIGFTCSLDDFGSGYSALGVLQNIQIDCLKLDRQFFAHSFQTENTKAVIETIMQLAQKLGIATVAEGVEKEEQVLFLTSIGCDLIQGYYFFPPLAQKQFEAVAFSQDKPQ